MGKLHELLVIESTLGSRATVAQNKAKSLFKDGKGKFIGQTRVYQPFDDEGETLPDENTTMATTIKAELDLLHSDFGAWLDAALQKEVTNQSTQAELSVGGAMFQLPATALLNLESKLVALRQVYNAVPVNDETVVWSWDDDLERFVSNSRITNRSKKVPRRFIKYEATAEHPAQVDTYTEDIAVGTWTTIIHSGMASRRQKRIWIERIDELLKAAKSARQRANDIEVESVHIADSLFDYIHQE